MELENKPKQAGTDSYTEDSPRDMPDSGPNLEPSVLDSNAPSPSAASEGSIQQIQQTPIQPQPLNVNYAPTAIDEIEELVESVVEEKWRTLMENFGDIGLWKEKVRVDVISLKQELVRLDNRFENLQKAVLGKIQTYDRNITDVGSEIKALEKVFQRILNPLSSNIKELERLTQRLKK